VAATKIPNLLIFVRVFLFICNSSIVSLIAVSLKFLSFLSFFPPGKEIKNSLIFIIAQILNKK